MNFKNKYLLLALPLLILVAGCAPECEPEDYPGFYPILESPADGSEINYQNPPRFDWTHEESCTPSNYHVHFVTDEYGDSLEYGEGGDVTKKDLNSPLLPNKHYQWYVVAVWWDGYELQSSPRSQTWSFTTDGGCSAAELEPPVLLEPQYGSWLGEATGPGPASVDISWQYPGDCFPESFHYQLATDPEFTNIITSGITDWNDYDQKVFVPRCARIYWRVEARTGSSSGGYSEPSRFTHASISSCFQNQQSIDAALIKGHVFDDYCKSTKPWIPEGIDIWPPCVFGEPYGIHADGNRNRGEYVHEVTGETVPFEAGIPNVIVDLGSGPCPSTGLDQMATTEDGAYYFLVQSPGEYCVSVSKDKNPALDHGIWTRPLTNQRITEYTVTFQEGDDLNLATFGWDKNDFLKIDFWVHLTSFCRAGDSISHEKLAVVESGQVIPLLRRNEQGTWFETIVDGIPCLISLESGEPAEDPGPLPIFDPYPDPLLPDIPGPSGSSDRSCSSYTNESSCTNAGCRWTPPGLIPSKCVPK